MEREEAKGGNQMVEGIQNLARSVMTVPKNLAAERLGSMAEILRETATQFHGRQDMVAEMADSAAKQVEKFASTIRDSDVKQLLEEVENLARRKPVMVFGAAMALGFMASRLWKSSSLPQSETAGSAGQTGAGIPEGVSLH